MPLRPKHLGVLVFPKDKDTLLHGHSPAIEIRSISAVTSFAATSRKSRTEFQVTLLCLLRRAQSPFRLAPKPCKCHFAPLVRKPRPGENQAQAT